MDSVVAGAFDKNALGTKLNDGFTSRWPLLFREFTFMSKRSSLKDIIFATCGFYCPRIIQRYEFHNPHEK